MDAPQAAKDFLATLSEGRGRGRWKFELRASSLPMCQIKYVWFRFDEKLGTLPKSSRKYITDYFKDVGVAVHATTQRWLGRKGLLFGSWACTNHKCKVYELDEHGDPVPVVIKKFGPQKCPSCRRELTYSEFAFGAPLTGHCDGLIKLGLFTPDDLDFVLLEIKTVGAKKIAVFKTDGPPITYRLQATSYIHKLNEMGFNVKGVLFLFIPREGPMKAWTDFRKTSPKKAKRIHDSIIRDYDKACDAIETGDFSGLSGTCVTEEDAIYCPYRANCFSPVVADLFQKKHDLFYENQGSSPAMLPRFPEP